MAGGTQQSDSERRAPRRAPRCPLPPSSFRIPSYDDLCHLVPCWRRSLGTEKKEKTKRRAKPSPSHHFQGWGPRRSFVEITQYWSRFSLSSGYLCSVRQSRGLAQGPLVQPRLGAATECQPYVRALKLQLRCCSCDCHRRSRSRRNGFLQLPGQGSRHCQGRH